MNKLRLSILKKKGQKMNKGIMALQDLNNRFEKGLNGKMDMVKSLKFKVTGKKIKDAISAKLVILRIQLKELRKKATSIVQPNMYEAASAMLEMPDSSAEVVTSNEFKWKIQEKEREIERLERITRNLEDKRTFDIDEYELQKYGL
jgi:hypothetical protein